LRETGGDFIGAEEHHGAGLRAELNRVEEDDMREGSEIRTGDPAFGVGAGIDHMRDAGLDEALGEMQTGGIITMAVPSDADPECGLVAEQAQLMTEIRH
jgi:hypothetical protein